MSHWDGLNNLTSGYPSSLHMALHMLLALVVAPLALLCVPSHVARRAATAALLRRPLRILRRPFFTWFVGIGAMWFWQLPPIGEAAIRHPVLYTVESVCFLITGTIFWWPIASPLPDERIKPVPWAVLYLFSACLCCTVLGILIAFAPAGYFPSHVMSHSRLSYAQPGDQQIGGLVMWVGGCFIYLSAIMAMFARWYNTSEETAWALQQPTAIEEASGMK
jgi:putative membrane protein